jgi:serine/threonine-protein kinase
MRKIPDSFASDPERLGRFTREAQTLVAESSIFTSTAWGSSGVRALVMELVRGEDLAADCQGAIHSTRRCSIAKQIAEALEPRMSKASFIRIISNPRTSRCGSTVGVLDFGLASDGTSGRFDAEHLDADDHDAGDRRRR